MLKHPIGLNGAGSNTSTPTAQLHPERAKNKASGSGFTLDHPGVGLGARPSLYLDVSPLEAYRHHPLLLPHIARSDSVIPHEAATFVSSPAGLAPSWSPSLDEAPPAC